MMMGDWAGGAMGAMGGAMFLWWLAEVAIVVLLVVGVVVFLRRASHPAGGTWTGAAPGVPPVLRPDEPLEILRQRYARGEIDDEEYERRRRVLSGG